MALPSKKSKLNINLDPPKAGSEYLKYGMDRIEELMLNSDKNTNYLPRTIDFHDIDSELKNFVDNGSIKSVIDGKETPSFYLENERWGEFSKTWKLMDADKNVPTPYITVRRTEKREGTRLGRKWAIPQGKAHRYMDVPIMDDGQVIYLRFKIPEPTNVDLTYDLRIFSKYRNDINYYDKQIMNAFKSRQEYLFVKGNPMPVLLDGFDSVDTIKNIDGDRYYVSVYRLRVQGFIQNEEKFEITQTSRQPKIGIDLSANKGSGARRASPNINIPSESIIINVRNTDSSYSVNTDNDLILPDIIVTDYTGGTTSYPAVQDLAFSGITPNPENVIYYNYPFETQSISYRDGDAGWVLENEYDELYSGRLGSYKTPRLEDYFTLTNNNSFGNRSRFTDITGGTISNFAIMGSSFLGTQRYIIDHFTGLGWSPDLVNGDQDTTWFDAIDFATGYTTEGFTDFHLPSVAEFNTLAVWASDENIGGSADFWRGKIFGFGGNENTTSWTSSTHGEDDPTHAHGIVNQTNNNLTLSINSFIDKVNPNVKYWGVCRIHFKADSLTQPDIETLNVSNSDDSYDVNTGTNLELPDIQVTDYLGNQLSYPSVQDLALSGITPIEFTYNYPQLTQETSYRDGDEGWQLANVWNSIYNDSNRLGKFLTPLTDFYTLAVPNEFGNNSRFTTTTGSSWSGLMVNGDIIRDNYLGVEILYSGETGVDFDTYIDNSSLLDGDWYGLPIAVFEGLFDRNSDNAFEINDYMRRRFNNTGSALHHSVTTDETTVPSTQNIAAAFTRTPYSILNVKSFVRGATYFYRPITSTTYTAVFNPVNVSNSDDSYSATTLTNLELPDIQVTDYTGGTTSYPAVKDLTFSGITPQFPLLYNFPYITQDVSYRDGDSAWVKANVYANEYAKTGQYIRPTLVDEFTLGSNNVFGNTSRFTDITGGTYVEYSVSGAETSGNQRYYIDHFTGLGWMADLVNGNQDTDWNTAIDYATGYTAEGFTDFHLPSVKEFLSLSNNLYGGDFYKASIFGWDLSENTTVWTSDTSQISARAYTIQSSASNQYQLSISPFTDKTESTVSYFGVCRKHF